MPRLWRHRRQFGLVATGLVVGSLLGGCDGTDPVQPVDPGLPPGWLGGQVGDDTGQPLAGIRVVAVDDTLAVLTGADGRFAIGPFAAGDTVTLLTESPDTVSAPGADDAWYDFVTGPLTIDAAEPVTITLLTRYDIELDGMGPYYPSNDHFSHFLEFSTNPLASPTGPSVSWGWEAFPLAVHIPDTLIVHPGANGDVLIDAGACMRDAIARWNDACGCTVLSETGDAAGAQVRCTYPELVRARPAETRAIDPEGCGFTTCPPSQVEVRMSSEHIPDATAFAHIAVHEFGHALGFWGHVSGSRALMENGVRTPSAMLPTGGFEGSPIHRFEVRAILAKQRIPQGTALEQYEGTFPEFADFPPTAAAAAASGARP
jgi:hypothetical protein